MRFTVVMGNETHNLSKHAPIQESIWCTSSMCETQVCCTIGVSFGSRGYTLFHTWSKGPQMSPYENSWENMPPDSLGQFSKAPSYFLASQYTLLTPLREKFLNHTQTIVPVLHLRKSSRCMCTETRSANIHASK